MKFEWDVKKNQSNIKKHGISFDEASYVFSDPFSLSLFDEDHSDQEDRWVLLGKSLNKITLIVIHTFRDSEGVEYVRIISARKASISEQKIYERRKGL